MKKRRQYSIKATVYDKQGKKLAEGFNSYQKSHPYQAKLAKIIGRPDKIFLHAEVQAIIRAQKKGTPYKIFIERYNKKGEPVLAEPCPICKLAIKEAGIKRIEYTV